MSQRQGQNRGPAKRAGATKPSSSLGAHPLEGPRPPEYVDVLWITEQLRARLQRNNAALAQQHQSRHGRTAAPDADVEAEP